ncbi:thiamine phosphate synthase [Cellulomonas massiliensis]|uniref:thiamine phosphate synthase n=1 Tax=Cellulomonas massiliensis TaxID=1465811 RepID=UPI000300FFA3|nr:thiamine phosphate synthase [Cellulomonas massiliensis]
MSAGRPSFDPSVYLVTDSGQARRRGRDVVDVVAAAVRGGVTAVQVREKEAPTHAVVELLGRVAAVLPAGVALVVNDRVDALLAARRAGIAVDGVHLGQADLPVGTVRRLVGADALVGVSARTPAELAAAEAAGADYVGIGPVRTTTTKRDAPAGMGLAAFGELARAARSPAVGIGGLTVGDVPALRRAGAAGVAVVSAVCLADDPRRAAAELAAAWAAAA